MLFFRRQSCSINKRRPCKAKKNWSSVKRKKVKNWMRNAQNLFYFLFSTYFEIKCGNLFYFWLIGRLSLNFRLTDRDKWKRQGESNVINKNSLIIVYKFLYICWTLFVRYWKSVMDLNDWLPDKTEKVGLPDSSRLTRIKMLSIASCMWKYMIFQGFQNQAKKYPGGDETFQGVSGFFSGSNFFWGVFRCFQRVCGHPVIDSPYI